ncbi:MAG: chemotaxis protein CheW [Leptospira sp.]|nr:chemotaxis protein CheW [Leptospira sp.]
MEGILGEYTEIFLEESEDQVEELNSNLLLLEKDHNNQEIINDIFRAAHSLKSSAAFVGLYNLSELAHKMENLLQKIREGSLEVNTVLVNILFKCFDLIRNVISEVSNGRKLDEPYTEMIQELQDYENNPELRSSSTPSQSEKKSEASTPIQKKTVSDNSASAPKNSDALVISAGELAEIHEELEQDSSLNPYKIRIILKEDTPMKGLRFTLILQNLGSHGLVYKSKPTEEELESGSTSSSLYFVYLSSKGEGEICEMGNIDMVETMNVNRLKLPPKPKTIPQENANSSSSAPTATEDSAKNSTTKKQEPNSQSGNKKPESDATLERTMAESKVVLKSIKVSSDKLDQLMNNVGELVITNSGFQKIYDDLVATFGEDVLFNELKSKIDQINRISKDLQTGIMNIRMVPIGSVFNRFSRLVRDLALETNKEIELVLRGESTELDKKVIDAIGEPMIHLIRNSVDHGIETTEERAKKGKPPVGTIELNAYQGGSNIMVEIRDDGKGLSRKKILEKAIEKGLATLEDASGMTDSEVYQFIFAPGFSTADKVTDISGRGVGMNVVNKLIQEFKGKIIINSQEGVGSSFTLSFPQALAIIPSILVVMEEEVYAFPLSEVGETIKVNQEQITTLEGHEIINLRGEVLPIYRLNRIVGLADGEEREELPVVIVNYKSRKLGFIVDDLIGKHETVIKSLAKNFQNVPGLTGATIMGDGTIILVLDIPGLVELASGENRDDEIEINGEMMKRISSVRSLENSDTEYVFKTKHATNIFNAKLFESRAKDKTKSKRGQRNHGRIQEKEEAKIIVSKEELIREQKEEESNVSSWEATAKPEENHYLPEPKEDVTENQEKISESLEVETSSSVSSSTSVASVPPVPEDDEDEFFHHLEGKVGDVDEEHKKKASEIIKGFIAQKNERMKAVQGAGSEGISDMLNKDQLRKLETVMNTGMMNAGMVLSQLVGKEVELFVPDITLTDKDGLVKDIRYSDENFFGMKIRMNGDLNGNLLMMFSEENGREVAGNLLGKKNLEEGNLSEDSVSVLGEISNIVCSGVINSLSNKTKTEILPSVPEFITGKFNEVLDIVKPERTKFLSMHTEFNHDGNNLLGMLLFLPDFDELVELISKI